MFPDGQNLFRLPTISFQSSIWHNFDSHSFFFFINKMNAESIKVRPETFVHRLTTKHLLLKWVMVSFSVFHILSGFGLCFHFCGIVSDTFVQAVLFSVAWPTTWHSLKNAVFLKCFKKKACSNILFGKMIAYEMLKLFNKLKFLSLFSKLLQWRFWPGGPY